MGPNDEYGAFFALSLFHTLGEHHKNSRRFTMHISCVVEEKYILEHHPTFKSEHIWHVHDANSDSWINIVVSLNTEKYKVYPEYII